MRLKLSLAAFAYAHVGILGHLYVVLWLLPLKDMRHSNLIGGMSCLWLKFVNGLGMLYSTLIGHWTANRQ